MHGAIFGNKHTKEDYGAFMNYARITPPAVKENYVDIAGGNSSIDLTEAVGGVVFEDGRISFKFTLFDVEKKEKMKSDLHGKRLKIQLEREPEFYYEGRVSITSEAQIGNIFEVCADARVKPYKMEDQTTKCDEKVDGVKDILLLNERMPAMPAITVRGDMQISFEGIDFALKTGIYKIPEITLMEGINRLRVSGNGSVRFEYRKGRII